LIVNKLLILEPLIAFLHIFKSVFAVKTASCLLLLPKDAGFCRSFLSKRRKIY